MKILPRLILSLLAAAAMLISGCEEYQSTGLSSTLSSGNSGSTGASTAAPVEALTKHDVALRFLTAFIRLDRNMASRYASPEALSKFDWNMSHRGNIPYYDDKMILYFNGGWARVYFQDIGGTYRISDFDVHRR
jgi:hypothetical protein